jgi:hypothetical protein
MMITTGRGGLLGMAGSFMESRRTSHDDPARRPSGGDEVGDAFGGSSRGQRCDRPGPTRFSLSSATPI